MSLWMKSYGVTIPLKATEQYFPVVLVIMLHKVVLTFELEDQILLFDHSNESYLAVPSLGTTCFLSFSQNEILKIVLHFDFC